MTDRIAEIRGRLDKATPGEWELGVVKGDALKFCADKIASIRGTVEVLDLLALPAPSEWHQICIPGQETIIAETGCGPTSKANAALIAHAPADLAFLLGEVEKRGLTINMLESSVSRLEERAEKAERELAEAKALLAKHAIKELDVPRGEILRHRCLVCDGESEADQWEGPINHEPDCILLPTPPDSGQAEP